MCLILGHVLDFSICTRFQYMHAPYIFVHALNSRTHTTAAVHFTAVLYANLLPELRLPSAPGQDAELPHIQLPLLQSFSQPCDLTLWRIQDEQQVQWGQADEGRSYWVRFLMWLGSNLGIVYLLNMAGKKKQGKLVLIFGTCFLKPFGTTAPEICKKLSVLHIGFFAGWPTALGINKNIDEQEFPRAFLRSK